MNIAVAHKLEVFDPRPAPSREEGALIVPIRAGEAAIGETVSGLLDRLGWCFELPTVCRINGLYYGRAEWADRVLAANDNVEFVSRPLGGGAGGGSTAKSVGAIVALVALTVLAPYVGAAIFGAGTAAAGITASLLVAGGAMAISHFLKPKQSGKAETPESLANFNLSTNMARPLQPIPAGYGRLLDTPDVASGSYSEYDGDGITTYSLFCVGCGEYAIEEARFGDTPVWTAAGGYSPNTPGITLQIVEPGQNVTLFPVNVVTSSTVSGTELTTSFTPGIIVNAAGTLAKQIMIDLVWQQGAQQTYKERTYPLPTDIAVEGCLVDASGAQITSWGVIFAKSYSHNKNSMIRVTERINVPPGRWMVRVRRTNRPFNDGGNPAPGKISGFDDVTWTALRCQIDGPQAYPDVTMIAVKTQAGTVTKGLNALSNSPFRIVRTRKLPVWTGSTFAMLPTRSIAWAALDVWRNTVYSAGQSLNNVDLQSFVRYDQLWAGLGHTFDHTFTEPTSLDEALETVLRAGRAFPAPIGDKLTVVRDEPRGIPRMMFNDYNLALNSLKIDYVFADDEFADGVQAEYIDETTWRTAEVTSAPDGVALAKPSRQQLIGVTKRHQAAGLARFAAAEHFYRRVNVSWKTGAEGKLLKAGDLVTVCTEEPETWGESAEVRSYDATRRTITLTSAVDWSDPGFQFWAQFQRRDGRPWGPVRVSRGASDLHIVVSADDLAAEASRQGMTLWDAIARSDTQERALLDFSPGQPRSYPVLITDGTPDQDGEEITLNGTLDAPEVYNVVETGVSPLPQIPQYLQPGLPVITAITGYLVQSGTNCLLKAGWLPPAGATRYLAQITYDDGASWSSTLHDGESPGFEAIVSPSDLKIRVKAFSASGLEGPWSISARIIAPDITISNQFVRLQLTREDFEPSIARTLDTLPLLMETVADLATEGTVVADAANERGKAAIKQIATVKVDVDKAFAIFGTEVLAEYDDTGATISDHIEVLATETQAVAQATQAVKARIDNVNGTGQTIEATVTTQSTAIADIRTGLSATYTVKLTAGDQWSGFHLVQTDGTVGPVASEFKIATDRFLVGAPSSGIGFTSMFTVDSARGRVAINGDLLVSKSVSASQIAVDNLQALSGNMGSLTAGTLIGANGKLFIELNIPRITMYN